MCRLAHFFCQSNPYNKMDFVTHEGGDTMLFFSKTKKKSSSDSAPATFTFDKLPANLSELTLLPECSLDTPFKTAALAMAVLCNYSHDSNETFKMLDYLNGPADFSNYEKQFIRDRLQGQPYKPCSFFEGASRKNGYTPTTPYSIHIYDNPYSFSEENWATLYVKSAGADSLRPIKLRKKPSTGQWFVSDIQCLSDIRMPESEDPWA